MKLSLSSPHLKSRVSTLRAYAELAPQVTPLCVANTYLPCSRILLTAGHVKAIARLPAAQTHDALDLALALGDVLTTDITLPQAQALAWIARRDDDLTTLVDRRLIAEATDTGALWVHGLRPEQGIYVTERDRWHLAEAPEHSAATLRAALALYARHRADKVPSILHATTSTWV